jgi:2',3'-cyclic-nucleotide 2'-phosphodiesterase (5'-nucleotidase family)
MVVLSVVVAAWGGACSTTTTPPDIEGRNIRVLFVHTTDMHSRMLPYNMRVMQTDKNLGLSDENGPFGGIARVAYLAKRERAKVDRSLHIDTGDSFQGAPIFNVFQGEVEMKSLSMMGVDVMAIGNHEFDSGEPNVADKILRYANFPVLAANYVFSPTGTEYDPALSDLVAPYAVFNLQGLRVGVIGLGNTSSMASLAEANNSLGITPIDQAEATQFYIDHLRPLVDVIVIASHLGLTDDGDLISCTSGADLVLGGHHHVVLNPPKAILDGGDCYYEVATRFLRRACEKQVAGILRPGLRPEAGALASACERIAEEGGRFLEARPEVAGAVLPDTDRARLAERCIEALDQELEIPQALGALGELERSREEQAYIDLATEATCWAMPVVLGWNRPPQRSVPLAHSGAFAKYVGKLDAVFAQAYVCSDGVDNDGDGRTDVEDAGCVGANDGSEAQAGYQYENGWELESFKYEVLPVDRTVPDDTRVAEMIEPYMDELLRQVPLDQILGYAPTDVHRFGSAGGDSALGNLVAESMMRRKGVETDFALTNSLGIRTDVFAGPVTVDDMYNVFPFENTITTMYLSGREVVDLFDYVARRSGARGCQAQVQIAGASVVLQCGGCDLSRRPASWPTVEGWTEGCALQIRIGGREIALDGQYQMAANDYIAKGGSGFMVLKRNTTQINTGIPLRESTMDRIRQGRPCGDLGTCRVDGLGIDGCPQGYVCGCVERSFWNDDTGTCDAAMECPPGGGTCVLGACVRDVTTRFVDRECSAFGEGPMLEKCRCVQASRAFSQCAAAACIDRSNGVVEDGRLTLVAP